VRYAIANTPYEGNFGFLRQSARQIENRYII
jgi:hypothetical protein